jgi:two-component system response regulator AtoC
MQEVFDTVKQIAPTRATVLIEGESGTGKELIAHAIHHLSNRARSKFIAVHCAALSSQLLESELFGHEKGAFTGASERRAGRFEQANGGTLFLDEIGEIDASTQVKILRALDPGLFERVGGNQTLKTDVRLIAATNKNLEQLVKEGKFRDDLFYRLNVVNITMPPLRERKEDIPLLVAAFLKSFARDNAKPFRECTADAMQAILAYHWPGNVRELRTAVEHGVVMATGPKITLRDLPANIRQAAATGKGRGYIPSTNQPYNLEETEYRLIERALAETNHNITEAAKKLGISRRTLHRKLKAMREEEANGEAKSETGN